MTTSVSDTQQSPAQELICFPASFAQQSLWFIDQLTPGRATYNLPSALRIRGDLDVEVLKKTLEEVARRHETLRTRFVAVRGEPQQVIEDQVNVQLPVLDLTYVVGEKERETAATRLARAEAQQPFNLQQAPLFRGKLLRLGALNHVLLFTMHHIISDAWSTGVLIEEVSVLYDAFSAGQPSPLPELPIQYADYSVWQRQCLEGGLLEPQLAYWKQQLAETSVLKLPTDLPRPISQNQHGATCSFVMDANLTQGLKKLAEERGATLFMVLLAAFQTLLYRYSGQDDIAVGTPVAGRRSSETEKLIGFFINTLVLQGDLSGAPSFIGLLQRTKEVTLEAYAHQDVPFEKLVEVLSPERNLGSTPFFQVMITLQNAPDSDLRLGGALLEPFDVGNNETSKFDLLLQLGEDGFGKLTGSLQYDTDLFEAVSVTRMIDHYKRLLSGIVANPSQSIAVLPLLTAKERKQVIEEWNRTEAQYPREKCVHELFEEQVARTPQAVAVVDEGGQFNYEELNRRANQLAHYLRKMGVGPEVRVGVCVGRDLEMVVVLMGILKAGGTYVPLDPAYPAARLNFMLQDAGAFVVLTERRFTQQLASAAGQLLDLEQVRAEIARQSTENPRVKTDAENLAWIIYTSGSTGQPKGAGIRHGSAVSLIQWAREVFTEEELSGVLASTSICFDLSTFELFVPLSWGGTVVMAENALQLPSLRHAERVRLLNTVPSAMAELVRMGAITVEMRTVNLAGEALQPGLVEAIYEGTAVERLFNLYGPSEDTTYSTYAAVSRGETGRVTIGRPVSNTQVYVVDGHMQPVPVGIKGELYLGGAGQARGYLNRAELTAEKFVPNPFSQVGGERLYRTGDLVRYQTDGSLEFLGRLDSQVKIRGYRIELGEVEVALLAHPEVAQAVVVAREDRSGDKRLVGYVVAEQEAEESNNGNKKARLQISELREHLMGKLPEYMVPTAYVQLEKIPLTHNGKTDRKSLPEPDKDIREEEYVGPRNAMEETLCQLWQEVLRRERVGIHDNFFNIGGHSLLAVQVISRIKSVLAIEMPLSALFMAPTVARMAEYIAAMNGHERLQGKLAATPTVMTVQSMLAEAVLDPVIAPNSAAAQQSPAVPGSNLLLTGASGFLGAFLLAEIMQQMPAARVHCLVRAATAQEGMRRVCERLSGFALWREEFSDRIVPLPGDLAKQSLGLSSDDFHRLANEIDTIYHNGASVNPFYAYSRLKSANVNGTSEILRLATTGSVKPVHYVSTNAVFLTAGGPGPELVNEETSLDAIAGLMGGYGQSKWVAERLVRIARERGIPVTIYRPGWIAAHSRTGLGSHDNLLSLLLQCSLQLGAAPDFDLELDLAPADYVSGALVWLSRQPGSIGKTFHLSNPRTVPCNQIPNWLIEAGMPVERLSLSDWFERLHRAAPNSANNAVLYSLRPFFGAGAAGGLDNNEAVAPQPRFDCRRTVESLAGSGWVCPPPGPEQFRLILSHLERGVGPTVARMAKHIAAANGHEGLRSSPVLVNIQSRGSRVPFFCVHAVGGQVISYAELSQELGLEQPFYGLQSPPANFSPESDISIEQMATLYNREIRSVQPVGPYLLSGWSMGGLVAWEMAQQLMKEGETIRLLALIDTIPPSGYLEADDRDDEISMLARFALDMSRLVGKDTRPLAEQFSQADAQDQWKMVQETLTSYGVLAPKTAHAEMTALLNVFTRNALAINNYSLQYSQQPVVFFRASDTPERLSRLWTRWARGGIQFHSIPGNHFTMLRRPNVRVIAEVLQSHMFMVGGPQ